MKDTLDAQPRTGHRMHTPRFLAAPRQGHIDAAACELSIERFPIETLAACLDRRLNDGLGFVDLLAGRGPLVRGQLAETLELLGQQALLAEQAHAYLVQIGKSARCVGIGQRPHRCRPPRSRSHDVQRSKARDRLRAADLDPTASSGLKACLGFFCDGGKGRHIVHGEIRKHLAVDGQFCLVQSIDERAVAHAAQARRRR
jgi:hypothetical protein